MSAVIPIIEPVFFQAGDTLRFNRDLADYPANAGWTLSYALRNATQTAITYTAGSAGATFEINIPAATTAAWAAGKYLMAGEVSDGTHRYTVYRDEITITPNLSVGAGVLDYRTNAQKMLDLVEAVIAGSMARREISYSINGRSLTAKTDKELHEARDYWKSCVAQEKAFGKNRRILTRFVSP